MQLSVIVPVLNEEEALPTFLDTIERWDCVSEVLFVDGGSTDSTKDLLQGYSVLSGVCGRGAQCRLGVQHAQGNAFVFVHVDSLVPRESMRAIDDALESGIPWGCLTLRFDDESLAMRIGALGSNARVRFTGIPFGDQVMFMTRTAYESVGGMPDMPIMEDYELSRRLRTLSWPKQLRQEVCTSARRFTEGGAIKTMLQMRQLRHLYRTGADVDRLSQAYREAPNKRRNGLTGDVESLDAPLGNETDRSHVGQ